MLRSALFLFVVGVAPSAYGFQYGRFAPVGPRDFAAIASIRSFATIAIPKAGEKLREAPRQIVFYVTYSDHRSPKWVYFGSKGMRSVAITLEPRDHLPRDHLLGENEVLAIPGANGLLGCKLLVGSPRGHVYRNIEGPLFKDGTPSQITFGSVGRKLRLGPFSFPRFSRSEDSRGNPMDFFGAWEPIHLARRKGKDVHYSYQPSEGEHRFRVSIPSVGRGKGKRMLTIIDGEEAKLHAHAIEAAISEIKQMMVQTETILVPPPD